MKKITLILLSCITTQLLADIVIIAHPNVPKIDAKEIGKIFTGKMIMVQNTPVIPYHLNNSRLKDTFLNKFVGMNFEEYIAYWTVRQYIGKGAEPKTLASSDEMIQHITATPGAIGYIDSKDFKVELYKVEK